MARREVMRGLSNVNFYSPRPRWLQPLPSIQTAFQITFPFGSTSAKATTHGLTECLIHHDDIHTALLMTKDIDISQHMKCSEIMLTEFPDVTMIIIALKQLIW